jgi:hypothetical protein
MIEECIHNIECVCTREGIVILDKWVHEPNPFTANVYILCKNFKMRNKDEEEES